MAGGLVPRGHTFGSEELDIQVRWYLASSRQDVEDALLDEAAVDSHDLESRPVEWRLAEIMDVEEFDPTEQGCEVIGFIASARELEEL